MQRAKSFMFVCVGILALVLSFHLGAVTATAQSGAQVAGVFYWGSELAVVTTSGDVYWRDFSVGIGGGFGASAPVYQGNYWGGGATPAASRPSWGGLKSRYATPSGGAQKPTAKP